MVDATIVAVVSIVDATTVAIVTAATESMLSVVVMVTVLYQLLQLEMLLQNRIHSKGCIW